VKTLEFGLRGRILIYNAKPKYLNISIHTNKLKDVKIVFTNKKPKSLGKY
jgi:hypothetical protein